MVAIRIDELKQRSDEVLRRLRETGEPVEVLDGGRTIAKLVPADEDLERLKDEQTLAALAELDRLSEESAASVAPGITVEDVIRDTRIDRVMGATAGDSAAKDAATAAIWNELERLGVEIGRRWPAGVSAAEAVRDDRREL